jgi:hypothetical protein
MSRESDGDDCCCRLVEARLRIIEQSVPLGILIVFRSYETRTTNGNNKRDKVHVNSNSIINLASTDCSLSINIAAQEGAERREYLIDMIGRSQV